MRTRWVPACALLAALGLAFVAEKAWAQWRCPPPPPPRVRYEERTEVRYRTEYRTAYRDVQRTIYRSVPETREQEITETVMVPTWREVERQRTVWVPETREETRQRTVCRTEWREEQRQRTVRVPETRMVEQKYTVCVPDFREEQRQETARARLKTRTTQLPPFAREASAAAHSSAWSWSRPRQCLRWPGEAHQRYVSHARGCHAERAKSLARMHCSSSVQAASL